MFSAFRGIRLVAEQRSRRALREAGLHFAAALRLSGRGKSPGLRPFGGHTCVLASGVRDLGGGDPCRLGDLLFTLQRGLAAPDGSYQEQDSLTFLSRRVLLVRVQDSG